FDMGAADRGMFDPGSVPALDSQTRAQMFQDYANSVLDHPALVGCHWLQYMDEPLTGRALDGENSNIGLVSVTETPYPELVAAARSVHTGILHLPLPRDEAEAPLRRGGPRRCWSPGWLPSAYAETGVSSPSAFGSAACLP